MINFFAIVMWSRGWSLEADADANNAYVRKPINLMMALSVTCSQLCR
jgi:hypothetical protein